MVKRIILVAVASFLLSLVSSCQKEVGLKSSNNVTIHATIASNEPSTRTAVSDDGKVSWIPGDDIFVFKASDFQEGGYVDAYSFESDLSSPSYSASFTGNMTVDEDETYFAFYPGSWSTVDSYWGTDEPGSMYNPFDGYLSPEQSESYDGDLNGNALLAAYSDGSIDNIRFMNVCSGLKFSLSEAGFTEISIKGNNSEAVAGAFILDFDHFEDTPVVNPVDGASKVAKMSAISGSMLPNEWLYLMIFPQTFENGITISFKKEGLPAGSVVINGPLEFKRGVWKKAENIDLKSKPEYEAVDLGLSVKWATFNVGATSPEERGDLYAWGETEPKESYNWGSYLLAKGGNHSMIKYCPTDKVDFWAGEGEPDGIKRLELGDDAAYKERGGTWRIPTKDEFAELEENCTFTSYSFNGVNGLLVSSKINNKTIFLPKAGNYYTGIGNSGYYWTSTLWDAEPYRAYLFKIESTGFHSLEDFNRYGGDPIRPVCD